MDNYGSHLLFMEEKICVFDQVVQVVPGVCCMEISMEKLLSEVKASLIYFSLSAREGESQAGEDRGRKNEERRRMTLFDERRHQKAASQIRFTLIEQFMHSKKGFQLRTYIFL